MNARSICNKLSELDHLLSTNPSVLCITESWLNPSYPDNLLINNHDYSVYRKDRSDRHGGGVCVLINNERFKSIAVSLPSCYNDIEIVAVDILNVNCCNYRIITVYRPPSPDSDIPAYQYCVKLCQCLDYLLRSDRSIILCGDFNLLSLTATVTNVTTISSTNTMLNYFTDRGLLQFVTEPTRYHSTNNTASILDLVLSNDFNLILNLTVSAPFGSSDHCIVQFDIPLDIATDHAPNRGSYDFTQANWSNIFTFLHNIDFEWEFSNCMSVADKFTCFYNIINDCISQYVPFITATKRQRKARYPISIRKLFSSKRSAWRIYKRTRTAAALNRYKTATSKCNSAVYQHRLKRETKVVNSSNISAFYRHCNSRFSSRSVIGPLRSTDGTIVVDPLSKANIFQRTFASYYTTDNRQSPVLNTQCSSQIQHILFTPTQVRNAINKLRLKSKCGPDNIPTEFIKRCSLWLTLPLTLLFQESFDTSYIPPIWLTANVCPIYKKGDRADPSNYRPISLTCIFCKIMETIIKNQLMSYLSDNTLISSAQHAFISKHSTASNMIESTREWSVAISNKQTVDVVYIDFQRAFDSVVHSKLLIKLGTFGISGKLLNWVSAFIHNRTQRVSMGNCLSDVISVTSGIVQGSVLGPILFILFVNDICNLIGATVTHLLFADDLKLFSKFILSDLLIGSSHGLLQVILNRVFNWSSEWQLPINIPKCLCLRLNQRALHCSGPQYNINDSLIANVSCARDLGVIVNSRLDYSDHIDSIVSKASIGVGMLFRGFVCRDAAFLCKAYKTYIRPILEFNSVVWNPVLHKYIDQIENVQRKFTKRIPSLSNLSYLQRLHNLNLQTLELRRLIIDITYYYKILHNLTPHNPSDFFTFHHPPSSSRKTTPLVIKPIASAKLLSSFQYRAIDCWNHLPSEIQMCNSLCSFKYSVSKIDLTSFLHGSCYNNLRDSHWFCSVSN